MSLGQIAYFGSINAYVTTNPNPIDTDKTIEAFLEEQREAAKELVGEEIESDNVVRAEPMLLRHFVRAMREAKDGNDHQQSLWHASLGNGFLLDTSLKIDGIPNGLQFEVYEHGCRRGNARRCEGYRIRVIKFDYTFYVPRVLERNVGFCTSGDSEYIFVGPTTSSTSEPNERYAVVVRRSAASVEIEAQEPVTAKYAAWIVPLVLHGAKEKRTRG